MSVNLSLQYKPKYVNFYTQDETLTPGSLVKICGNAEVKRRDTRGRFLGVCGEVLDGEAKVQVGGYARLPFEIRSDIFHLGYVLLESNPDGTAAIQGGEARYLVTDWDEDTGTIGVVL